MTGTGADGRVEDALAGWVGALRWEAVPPAVQARVEDLLLDALASALAGRGQALRERVERPALAFGGDGASTVICGAPASAVTAVFLNAYAITSATVCDVYRPGLCHVTPVTLPPLLALAERQGASGAELLAAFTAGLEVTVRLCRAIDYPAMRSRGWHSPGVLGPVGAAAAGARILGLDGSGVGNTLAHAAAQGAGTFAALGTEAVKFNQARGAVAGLLAALMGESGLVAAARWLTHTDGGMVNAYSNGGDPESVLTGLGSSWELEQISLRRWPAASSVQSLIAACLELRREHGITGDDVDRVEIELDPRAFEVSGPPGWDDPLSAQQSARWVAAATLGDGEWWIDQSTPERIADPALSAFAAGRVTVSPVSGLGQAGLALRVALRDGRVLASSASDAPGDPARPLTRSEIEEKTRRAAETAGQESLADVLIAGVSRLAAEASSVPFVRSLGAAPPGGRS